MHNIGTVIRFEIVRALKKKSFWVLAIGFPILIAAIFGIIYAANTATADSAKKMANERFSLLVTDKSGLISPALIAAFPAKTTPNKQAGIDAVKNGKVDAYFYYPAHLDKETIEVYGKDVDIFGNGKYESVAKSLLKLSVDPTLPPQVVSVVSNTTKTSLTAYRNGAEYDSFKRMILPGLFLVLFYFLISFFGNQMLVSTTEEKENRVIEMILTTIEARTLIIGKVVSLIALASIQAVLIIVPALVSYLLLHDKLSLPTVDLSTLPVDWTRIGIGFAIFALSFFLYTGLLVAIGSAMPTAKEANNFFGFFVLLLFGPLYAASLFISAPGSAIVQFLSYFPLTAPIPLLLRNAAGNLQIHEALIAITILVITASIVMAIAIRTFRFGALEYSRKLSLKEIFARK